MFKLMHRNTFQIHVRSSEYGVQILEEILAYISVHRALCNMKLRGRNILVLTVVYMSRYIT